VALPGQRILDLGTGTGLLARHFASHGARVAGIDPAEAQIDMARAAARRESVDVDFRVAAAEALPFDADTFDLVTACQCWWYFDTERVLPEVLRVLDSGGRLVVSYFSFLPRLDPIVAASEALVLEFNPDWTGADWDGYTNPVPAWSRACFRLVGMFDYDESIPFTRESWRGRMRALRGVAASLSMDEIEAFDRAHERRLSNLAPESFHILHRIHAQIFEPTGN
jgi:SAM-dependent methyltransferase